jgi:hypothetical protein
MTNLSLHILIITNRDIGEKVRKEIVEGVRSMTSNNG